MTLKGSRDNMSVILLKFAAGRDPTDEAREKDKQLEKSIESAVIAYSQSCVSWNFAWSFLCTFKLGWVIFS